MNMLFGPEWAGTPIAEDLELVHAPVGEPCLWCKEPIAAGDSGIITPFIDVVLSSGEVSSRYVPTHRACHLRQIVGSVACQLGHLPGEVCRGDDPRLTKRQAAEAAVRFRDALRAERERCAKAVRSFFDSRDCGPEVRANGEILATHLERLPDEPSPEET